MSTNKEIDEVTGVETTGHVWDGDLKELNKPLPKWWLYTLYATIIWSIGYWILYPAWPTQNGYTPGVLGYTSRIDVMQQVADAKKAQSSMREKLAATELAEVRNDSELLRYAMAGGKAAFGDNCAPCHGTGAQGFKGYPNLNDDDWIWGGKISDIHQTILYGVRSTHDETRVSDMPRFGLDEILDKNQINDTAEYVMSLSGTAGDAEAAERGKKLFAEQCVACHGENGKGNQELGAPNLTDSISLFGSDKSDIVETIKTGRGGRMPPWADRLDAVTVKSLAVYVHSLGGGQ